MFPLGSLKPHVTRFVRLWEKQKLTEVEVANELLFRFTFAILEFPNDWGAVAEALNSVPPIFIDVMVNQLEKCQIPSGGWHWPPGGPGLPVPGPPSPWSVADPAKADALNVLAGWLKNQSTQSM